MKYLINSHRLLFGLLLIAGLLFPSCNNNNKTKQKEVTTEEIKKETSVALSKAMNNLAALGFKTMITDNNYALVDVRTPEEFDAGHIAGAININIYDESFNADLQQLDKANAIMVYCKSGGRSANAMNQMIEMGFSKVYNLTGGFNGWKEAGFDQ